MLPEKIIIIDLLKYPFLVDFNEYLRKRYGEGVTLNEVIQLVAIEDTIVKRAKERIFCALKGNIVRDAGGRLTVDDEILAYNLSLIILSYVGDRWLNKRYAIMESKRVYKHLLNEDSGVLEYISKFLNVRLVYVGSEGVKIPVNEVKGKVVYEVLPYKIDVTDYLKVLRLLTDPSWKLVNQIVHEGKVYLSHRRAARLLSEILGYRIYESIGVLESAPPEPLDKIVNDVKKALEEYVQKYTEYTITEETKRPLEHLEIPSKVYFEAFPPCIAKLYNDAVNGTDMSHHARFALATFLLRIGMSVDEVVSLFSKAPDFKESIARYQVEHLAGLRGSRKKYLPFNCNTMRTLGLCIGTCNVKNPLVYYMRAVRKHLKSVKTKKQ